MPTPVFPTAYQVECRGLIFGQQWENVWHCQGPTPFDVDAASQIADDFQVGYAAIMLNLSIDLSLREIFVHNLAGPASGEFTLAITPPQVGGVAGPSLPSSNAICVSLRTALAGRRTRGRKYFSGLVENNVLGNGVDAATVNGIVTAVGALRSQLVTDGLPMSIFSRTGLTLVPVTAVTAVDLFVDSQRRRLTGRGN